MSNTTPTGIDAKITGLGAYMSGLERMNKGHANLGKGMDSMGSRFASIGNIATGAMRVVGSAVSGAAKLAAAGFASVVKEGQEYTKAMSNVGAISGAGAAQLSHLGSVAQNLGRTTKFTATEVADGMSFLAMAGFEVNDIIGAMPATLNLASAANIDLAKSADIVSNILSGFGAVRS